MPNAATARTNLVGVRAMGSACGTSGLTRVVAGDATMSLMYRKISTMPPCGNRMRPTGAALTTTQLDRVRNWINAGALDN